MEVMLHFIPWSAVPPFILLDVLINLIYLYLLSCVIAIIPNYLQQNKNKKHQMMPFIFVDISDNKDLQYLATG